MKLRLEHGLPFADARPVYRGQTLALNKVIVDTGSAGTLFSADHLLSLGLQYEPNDRVHRIRGVGGSEFVFTKQIESLSIAALTLNNVEIEIGAMDYGLDIDGIVDMDFLVQVGAVINVKALELRAA